MLAEVERVPVEWLGVSYLLGGITAIILILLLALWYMDNMR